MKIAIMGGTGFIGRHLIDYYSGQGDEVWVVTRSVPSASDRKPGVHFISWAQLEASVLPLQGLQAIVNLAGESINQRWTKAAKERVLSSRLSTVRSVARIVERLENKPAVVVNASGMSIYGTSETDTYDERSPHRIVDFLSGVVEEWEREIDRIRNTRVVKLRVGVVL
jgi:hypothetical protein